MYKDIFVPINKINKAEDGDKVLVLLEDWPDNADSPYGKVLKVLGKPGEHNTEIHSILAEYGLPYEFPHEVEEFANKLWISATLPACEFSIGIIAYLTFPLETE